MKNIKVLGISAAILAAISTSQVNAADTVVNGGTIHFKGKFTNAACAVDVGSDGQTVNLGEYRTASYGMKSDNVDRPKEIYTNATPFTIQLNDCDPGVSANASFKFTGAAASDKTVFETNAGGNATSARGVGIEIRDHVGTALTPDGSVTSAKTALIEGDNVFNFTARYKAIADNVTAGQANADVTFSIVYN